MREWFLVAKDRGQNTGTMSNYDKISCGFVLKHNSNKILSRSPGTCMWTLNFRKVHHKSWRKRKPSFSPWREIKKNTPKPISPKNNLTYANGQRIIQSHSWHDTFTAETPLCIDATSSDTRGLKTLINICTKKSYSDKIKFLYFYHHNSKIQGVYEKDWITQKHWRKKAS